ncbi:MAG: hypothetical protein SOW77_01260, partial [Ruminococcus sp.]|nr:hypothetical protein [Ruminococcus sp.]
RNSRRSPRIEALFRSAPLHFKGLQFLYLTISLLEIILFGSHLLTTQKCVISISIRTIDTIA